MATSRTGTTVYQNWRRRVIHAALSAGVTHCPLCGTWLDYHQSRLPNSAEADHIVPHSRGGRETLDNGRVICRRCNQSRGDRPDPKSPAPPRNTHSLGFQW